MKVSRPDRLKPNLAGPRPGLYAYTQRMDDGRTQIHLRVEADGNGLLLINANRALHLNPTATVMAWMLFEDTPEAEVIKQLRKRYNVSKQTARDDYTNLRLQIEELIHPNGLCPIHDLELDLLPPFAKTPSSPYRMDLALTYRCNANCSHCYNARARDFPEMPTERWQRVIDLLWDIGVPHLCFTGGEATLRDDLIDLIAQASSRGQIVGLLTNGRRLSDRAYVKDLTTSGLEHVQITIESHSPDIHERMVSAQGAWQDTVQGIRNALDAELFVMTNTTLLSTNAPKIGETIDFLADLGVPTIGCNALIYSGRGERVGTGIPEADLAPLLEVVRQHTDRHGQRLIWYTPTQYCHFDPVQMQLGIKACTAAMYNMCVEPDGGVIPCQSFYNQLGNILEDPWDSIWNHDLSLWLRERRYVPEGCQACPVLKECGGGCPLTLLHQPHQTPLDPTAFPKELIQR